MLQNIKSDIIYYKSGTDFELEFNLCGCCRMRLLTNKSPDRKTLVHSLARAVSRSQVIIIIGSLFGEEGIINITANAIGSKLCVVNNKEYSIESDQNIEILNGSVPLVTPEGYFGGCIIESGPQTMILLTDSKNIRKTIMTNLIHPYIEELYSGEASNKSQPEAVADTLTEEPALQPQAAEAETDLDIQAEEITDDNADFSPEAEEAEEELIAEPDIISDTPINEVSLIMEDDTDNDEPAAEIMETDANMPQIVINTDDDEEENLDEKSNFIKNFFSKKETKRHFSDELINDTDFDDDEEDYNEEADDYIEKDEADEEEFLADNEKKRNPLKLSMFIIMLLLLVVLAVLCYNIFYVPMQNGTTATEYLQEIFNTLFV